MRALGLVVVAMGLGCAGPTGAQEPSEDWPRSQAPDGFWDVWGDGKAEISTYSLTQPRYGQEREGEAILVFVTETFADDNRVKSDGGHDVEYPVLKLNEVRDFNTGIYDYNVMTSSFLRVDGGSAWGAPVKTSFSMQEWCGHVYEQLIVRGDTATRTSHSYFDGEADRENSLELPSGAVFADALPILVRGLVGRPTDALSLQIFDRSMDARFKHVPGVFREATLTWGDTETLSVPLGSFETTRVELDRDSGVDVTYWVETATHHRIVRWARSDGETGSLVGSTRTSYWNQHRNGSEAARQDIGIPLRTWPQ
jgi:hypothetical protein